MNERLIRVPSGIGDNIWLLQKLINAKERFRFYLGNGNPQRGKQIFDLLPQVAADCEYVDGLQYGTVDKFNIHREHKLWKEVIEKEFLLSINKHLERGYRIEGFFPDLETSWKMPWQTGEEICDDLPHGASSYIGIYASSYTTSRAWKFWEWGQWVELIQLIHRERINATFVIVGATWDSILATDIMNGLRYNNIPFYNTIGCNLKYVIKLFEKLNYFIAFPSGLPILNETIQACPTFMFYYEGIKKMMWAWAQPRRIEERKYFAQLFCEPGEAFEQLKKVNLFDYI